MMFTLPINVSALVDVSASIWKESRNIVISVIDGRLED